MYGNQYPFIPNQEREFAKIKRSEGQPNSESGRSGLRIFRYESAGPSGRP